MNLEFVDNSRTRVWIVLHYDRRYCARTAAFRAMFEGNKVRLMLYETLTENPADESDLLECLKDGVSVLITYVDVGRPDAFENNNPYLTLLDCKVIRSWLPRPVAMEHEDATNLNFFVEIESSQYTWNKEEK